MTTLDLRVGEPDPTTGLVPLLLVLPLHRLRLRWIPLKVDRSYTAVEILSPCCGVSLQTPLVPGGRYTCPQCFYPLPIGTNKFTLHNGGSTWTLEEGERALYAVVEHFSDPLEAELLTSQVLSLLVETMNRASAEYAWAPEGNLRGPEPLTPARQLAICERVVHAFVQALEEGRL